MEIYDPEGGHWESGPALPFSVQMPGTATVDGKIYSIGGHSQEIEGGSFRPEMFVLDPAVGKWEELEPMPSARESMGIARLDGKIYAAGGKGIDYSEATEIYDIEAGTWSAAARQVRLAGCRRGGRAHLRNGRCLRTKQRKAGVQVV